jgi:chromosome segregation ATPase
MQDEMKTEYKKTLTNEELDRLEQLGKDIEKDQKLYSDASIERLNLETEKQSLEQEIRTILYPRRDQLKSRSVDEDDSQLDERRKELESLKRALADILARQKSTENEVEKIAKSMRENQAKLMELQVNIPVHSYAYYRQCMQRLLARLNGIRRMWNKVWPSEQIFSTSGKNAIKEFEILESCLKKPMRSIGILILPRLSAQLRLVY